MKTPRDKREIAHAIRSLWGALLLPEWTRNELIDLGKLVFAKVPVEQIDPALLNKLLPRLSVVAEHLLDQILPAPNSTPATPDAPPPTDEKGE